MVLNILLGKRSATWKFINPVGGIGKNHFKRVYMKRVLKIMQNICTYTIAQQILSSLAVLLLHVFIGEKMRSFNTHNLKIFMLNFGTFLHKQALLSRQHGYHIIIFPPRESRYHCFAFPVESKQFFNILSPLAKWNMIICLLRTFWKFWKCP